MIRARTGMGVAALIVTAAAVAGIGAEVRPETRYVAVATWAFAGAGAAALPPAVVIARKPSLAEILDMVLGDRQPLSSLSRDGNFTPGSDEARIATVLGKYTPDRARANHIAAALVKEGRRRNIGSSLLVGVLLTENPWLDPQARSSAGARGLMQVMPFHAGKWGCASGDLFDIDANICHGVAILADNLKSSRTLPAALLGYNGCVRGTNTPDCWRYPSTVYRLARKGAEGSEGILKGAVPFSSTSVNHFRGTPLN
ncbi:MAG: transglycosylase SLT domain-containing protein [Gemmatimonadaceae bacterium]